MATTVLVVDDERTSRDLARVILTGAGYEVVEAADGREALDLYDRRAARRQAPDVVLTDLTMPGMDGVELIEQLRRAYGVTPIVVMTGTVSIPALPADVQILPKPYSAVDLTGAIQAALPQR